MDILEKLADLRVQATKERSHYYVASVVDEATAEIERLRRKVQHYRLLESWDKNPEPGW
jgi:hypothetical protein